MQVHVLHAKSRFLLESGKHRICVRSNDLIMHDVTGVAYQRTDIFDLELEGTCDGQRYLNKGSLINLSGN